MFNIVVLKHPSKIGCSRTCDMTVKSIVLLGQSGGISESIRSPVNFFFSSRNFKFHSSVNFIKPSL